MLDRDEVARLERSTAPAEKIIARLNDEFRQGRGSGRLAITRGVLALGNGIAVQVLADVCAFDAFSVDSDPYSEHDFGSITHRGVLIFWKIDYYDADMRDGSADPADRTVKTRVLTIMLADEY